LAKTTTKEITEPYSHAYTLSMDDIIDDAKLAEIRGKTFSRIPVHLLDHSESVVGILLVKSLIGYKPEAEPKTLKELLIMRDCKIKTPFYCENDTKIGRVLDYFKNGKTHMAIVCKNAKDKQD